MIVEGPPGIGIPEACVVVELRVGLGGPPRIGEAVFVLIFNAGLLRGPRFILAASLSEGLCGVRRVQETERPFWPECLRGHLPIDNQVKNLHGTLEQHGIQADE